MTRRIVLVAAIAVAGLTGCTPFLPDPPVWQPSPGEAPVPEPEPARTDCTGWAPSGGGHQFRCVDNGTGRHYGGGVIG